jgi:hypothetical protein
MFTAETGINADQAKPTTEARRNTEEPLTTKDKRNTKEWVCVSVVDFVVAFG